ncbi:autotransporter outer membrane beta-barrel domain-containing protein [Salmonella enterica subsp. enterica serovar Dublin]|nr:autotransporter outer membrane beta-barrel domain-containing protein [Salmonella enterica subsp. enterica serovar Dublin]EIC3535888.1 autotransporter outer membrane beta-barrel domain-containing protein [Salmonella enterica subsp. enterica serovar Dublin]EIC4651164.1 autotransporter outer membrane beta-barrel domain-containing protein [Salmonella enterica subsp. enterica serovar Dublin]HAG0022408.1 autotransporter outer membrane beta-barrel domain-containing protein [Salmonella enterica]
MNKIYNIVWNESSGMWVVTSELTRKGGQRHRKIKKTMLAGLIAGLMLPAIPAMAQMYNDKTLEYSDSVMELSAGDTATNTTINGGAQYISSGGNATSTTINEGVQIVFDGGTASTTTINGGYQEISSGGLATNTIIDGGDQYISSGGNAIDTTIENGYQTVFSGGNATSTIINAGFQEVSSGGSATSAIINGGFQTLYDNSIASSTVINNGFQLISSGGSSVDTTIQGGIQEVGEGGSASATTINDGFQILLSGGSATNTTINNGWQDISSGGSATQTIISGGIQTIYDGGSASEITINSGYQVISSGGSVTTTTIYRGGEQRVSSGGSAVDTTIEEGLQTVLNGGNVSGTLISGGEQRVSSGGSAVDTTIEEGLQTVLNGGNVSGTLISGGEQRVSSGGSAVDTTIEEGVQTVLNGGNVSGTHISGGEQNISSGGSAVDTTIEVGLQTVFDGGSVNGTIIDGGEQHISSGGSAIDTTINNGGTMSIAAGGSGTGIIQNNGGAIRANTSAILSGTNVNGSFSITNGSARNMLLENGGLLMVLQGHQAIDTQVSKGGELQVESGSELLGTTLIKDDGKLSGNQITNNGVLHFLDNSSANYSGTLDGTGSLNLNGGKLTLSGNFSQDSGIFIQNHGTMIMDNLRAMANVTIEPDATLRLENGSLLAGRITGDGKKGGNLIVADSVWKLSGDSTINSLDMSNGTVDFHSIQSPQFKTKLEGVTLNIGQLSGNGTFLMNTDIASYTGDKLNITGDANGNFVLNIKNTGQEPVSPGNPLPVVYTGGGDAVFTVNGGKVDAGVWEYYLSKDNTNWYLKSDTTQPGNPEPGIPNPPVRHTTKSTDAVLNMASAPTYIFNSELQGLRFRNSEKSENSRTSGGVWGHYIGSDKHISSKGAGYSLTQYGIVTGGDKRFDLSDGVLSLGAFVSFSDNNIRHNRGGKSSIDSKSVGLYMTYDTHGYYIDGVLKFNRFKNELRTHMSDGTMVSGDYHQNGFGGSLEVGKYFSLNENTWLLPYARTTALAVNDDNISLSNGMKAEINTTHSFQGEVGVNLGMDLDVGKTKSRESLAGDYCSCFCGNHSCHNIYSM